MDATGAGRLASTGDEAQVFQPLVVLLAVGTGVLLPLDDFLFSIVASFFLPYLDQSQSTINKLRGGGSIPICSWDFEYQ